jgi:hypothetical protein
VKGVDNVARKLTLEGGAYWGYIGEGTAKLELRVLNNGGTFFLGSDNPVFGPQAPSRVTLEVPVDADLFYAYTQVHENSRLFIMSGCTLDVGDAGARIDAGMVLLATHPSLAQAEQIATIRGYYAMDGGVVGFIGPVQIGDNLIWNKFRVDGDVYWFGGQFNPGIDCRAGTPAGNGNQWLVTGTFTASGLPFQTPPKIVPILQGGQQASGKWDVIIAEGTGQLQGEPNAETPWNLVTSSTGGVKKKWSVEK